MFEAKSRQDYSSVLFIILRNPLKCHWLNEENLFSVGYLIRPELKHGFSSGMTTVISNKHLSLLIPELTGLF